MALTIKDFQNLANGRYNIGEFSLSKSGKLSVINNHATLKFLNNKGVSYNETLAIKPHWGRIGF